MKQLPHIKKEASAYGGILFRTQRGRSRPRPLSTKHSMHLVLRSSRAVGKWSLRHGGNEGKVRAILQRFAGKYGVKLLSVANVGNHLHLHVQLANRHTYRPFIRGATSAIAMAVTGASRWNNPLKEFRFWDYRPFSRIVEGLRAFLSLRDYIEVNELEGEGLRRREARFHVAWRFRGSG